MSTSNFNINRINLVTSHMYLPLCCKPKMLSLLKSQPGLLEHTIRRILADDASDSHLLVFIADSDVMAQAQIAMGVTYTCAHRQVKQTSVEIRKMVDEAIAKISRESPSLARRISGVIHWADVAGERMFAKIDSAVRRCLRGSSETERDIQTIVRQLVKNLYTQRAQKGGRTNIFEANTLRLVPQADPRLARKYQKRYEALQEACILELSAIVSGFEHGGRRFTEMRYLNTDPTGMGFISAALQELRSTLIGSVASNEDLLDLKLACAQTHGLVLLCFAPHRPTANAAAAPPAKPAKKPLPAPFTFSVNTERDADSASDDMPALPLCGLASPRGRSRRS